MKKLLNFSFNICEEKFVMIYLCGLMVSCLLYFACYLYAMYRMLHPSPLTPADGFVTAGYFRLKKKVEPFLKRQVFVRR